jgi:tetratricopeptide (TPR) repeat protein
MAIVLKRKKLNELTDEQLLESYNFAIGTLEKKKDSKEGNKKEIEKINNTETQILNSLVQAISLECSSIENYFKPLYEASPNNYDLANSIRLLLSKNNCENSSFYLLIVKHVSKHEPSVARFTYIAGLELNNNQIDSATHYFKEALQLETENANKTKLYFELARIANKKGNKTQARLYARKVIATGHQENEAYTYIGNLYFNSANVCQSKDELIKRSIYIAAYLQYQKAGNKAKMALAKAQFPSMEDIFVQSKKEGDVINTGCWINEDVPLKKR